MNFLRKAFFFLVLVGVLFIGACGSNTASSDFKVGPDIGKETSVASSTITMQP
jgi:hypothetical protein